METIFTLYGPLKTLIGFTAVILEDAAVDGYEVRKDSDGAGYAFITIPGEGEQADLCLDTYEAIERAEGVTYEISHDAVAAQERKRPPMFKFTVGQRVKIVGDFRHGRIGTIEERRMSSGVTPVPEYRMRGTWFFEEELEAA